MAGLCGQCNKASGSTECGEFIDQLKSFQLLRIDCASLSKTDIFRSIGHFQEIPYARILQRETKSLQYFSSWTLLIQVYINVHAINTYVETEIQLHAFLTSALDGGKQSTLRSGCFNLRKEPPQHIDQDFGGRGDPESVWKIWERSYFLNPAENPPTVRQLSSPQPGHCTN